MKNYEEMAKDVLSRVKDHEAGQKLKRAKRTRIAAAAMPVCAAAVIGGGIWLSGALMHADKPVAVPENGVISGNEPISVSGRSPKESSAAPVAEKTTERREQVTTEVTSDAEVTTAAAVKASEHEEAVQTESNTAEVAPAETEGTSAEPPKTEPAAGQTTEAAHTTSAVTKQTTAASTAASPAVTTSAVGHGPMQGEGGEPIQYRTVIQSYPMGANGDMLAPKEGTFAIAYPVTMAMNDYGDDVDYRVCVELFKDGSGCVSDYASLVAEMKRLYSLGYTAGVESCTNCGDTTYFLWIQASREQVRSFQPSSSYGYILMFPYSNQGTSETVAFNGINY